MNWRDILSRSARTLRQAKARTLLTAAALAVGGFTLTATLAAANGARVYGNKLIDTNFDPSSLIVAKSNDLFGRGGATNKPQPYSGDLTMLGRERLVKELNSSDLAVLASFPGVQSVFENYSTNVLYVTNSGAGKYTGSIAAYDPTVTHQFDAGSISGNLPLGKVALPDDYLSDLNFSSAKAAINQSISLRVQQVLGGQETLNFKIGAVITSPSTLIGGDVNTTLLLNPTDAQNIFDYVSEGTIAFDRFLTATVRVKNGQNQAVLQKVENEIKAAGYGAISAKDAQATITQIVNVLQIIILVFGLITLIASFFGVVNTQYISVLERTREIGLMKALGMSNRSVRRLFIIEASWIGVIGAVIGSTAAIIVGESLNPWISKKIQFNSSYLLIFHPLQIFGLIVFLALVATVAGLLPARKAAKLDPIEALRTE